MPSSLKPPMGKMLKLPVKLVDGHWELAYGGRVPVGNEAFAELRIAEHYIDDPDILDILTEKRDVKVLDQGTTLRFGLVVKEPEKLTNPQRACLLQWADWRQAIPHDFFEPWISGNTHFVDVTLGPPTPRQEELAFAGKGGLWLHFEGSTVNRMSSSSIELPDCVASEAAISPNHAFTLLSQTLEPWRKAHTGNVYQRVFYEGGDGKWFPLEVLRDEQLAHYDQEIAAKIWQNFYDNMTGG